MNLFNWNRRKEVKKLEESLRYDMKQIVGEVRRLKAELEERGVLDKDHPSWWLISGAALDKDNRVIQTTEKVYEMLTETEVRKRYPNRRWYRRVTNTVPE